MANWQNKMSRLYFKTQTIDGAVPLITTIKEIANYQTPFTGRSTPDTIYEIIYETNRFKIISINVKLKEPLEITCHNLFQCEFIHLPIEIQKEMVNRSTSKSIIPFLLNVRADNLEGGFTWSQTPEGVTFWLNVIFGKQFDLFFKTLPNLKQQQNENQLQKERIPQSGGNESKKSGILCRGHKAKITIGCLSHQTILGRG